MNTKLRNIAMTIGLTVMGSATLIAQSSNKSVANIPFDFRVSKTTLPAGPYAFSYSPESRLIVLRNMDSGHSAMMLVNPTKTGKIADPKVIFQHAGEQYTLSEVWFAGSDAGYTPLKGKRDPADSERGLAASVRLLNK